MELSNNVVEKEIQPVNTRYVGTLTEIHAGYVNLTWGWSNGKFVTAYTLDELKTIKYDNNLETLIDCKTGINASVSYIFPCLEFIRKHYGGKMYFVDDKPYVKNIVNIFI
jgi:hypothetical protein